MEYVYMLEHCYELEDDYGTHEEIKFIGVYTTKEKANDTINRLKDKEGFKDHDVKCFTISKVKLNQDSWVDGFFTYKYKE